MPRERLRGIFTPNMVPLDSRGRINEGELRRLVEFLIQRGILASTNGTMGEFVRFSFEEHKEIVRIVVDQNRGRAKVLAGAAEFSLRKRGLRVLRGAGLRHGGGGAAVVPEPGERLRALRYPGPT